ncbi:transcription elongation factor GreA domain protein [Cooperia oncophora]
MTHQVYGLLVLSDKSLAESQARFYGKDEQGICIEPALFAEFTRKEIEFLEEFRHQIEIEIREAQSHEDNEQHVSAFDQVKELISNIEGRAGTKIIDLVQEE